MDRFPNLDPLLVLPKDAHPCTVREAGQLTNLVAIKLRRTHGLAITFSAHWVCRHFTYAHTFAAVVTINVLSGVSHITYPLEYCYVITEGQASQQLADFNARPPSNSQVPPPPEYDTEEPEGSLTSQDEPPTPEPQ